MKDTINSTQKWIKVKIIKHSPLLFQSTYYDAWHVDSVGKTIVVRNTDWNGAYYECKNGNSILKSDCETAR